MAQLYMSRWVMHAKLPMGIEPNESSSWKAAWGPNSQTATNDPASKGCGQTFGTWGSVLHWGCTFHSWSFLVLTSAAPATSGPKTSGNLDLCHMSAAVHCEDGKVQPTSRTVT